MKRFLSAAAAILMASSGCKPVVFDSIQEDPGAGPSTSASAGGGPSGSASALAMRGADVAEETVWKTDPESLILFVASSPLQCADPVIAPTCADAPAWQLILSIPPELDRPGVIDLADPRIGFAESILLASCGGGGGRGNGYWGTLEITSLDNGSVAFNLSGIQPTTETSFDGDYVAQRCGEAPVTPPPTPVVALFGSGVNGNPSSGTGPTADPDALYIFGGSSPGTCEEPVPTVDCTTNRQFMFSLPESLRVPGVISLDDPRIDAIYSTPGTSCGPATFHTGTLEITSIDASQIAFAIAGTEFTGLNGVYAGSICP